jgi:hypothetical protein
MISHNDLWLVFCGCAISVLSLLVGWFNKQLLQGMLNIMVDLVFLILTSINWGSNLGPTNGIPLFFLKSKQYHKTQSRLQNLSITCASRPWKFLKWNSKFLQNLPTLNSHLWWLRRLLVWISSCNSLEFARTYRPHSSNTCWLQSCYVFKWTIVNELVIFLIICLW